MLGIVRADIWSQIQQADFSFIKPKDGGARETKKMVIEYTKAFGVALNHGQYGLLITPGKPDMLSAMTTILQEHLQYYSPSPLVQTILQDLEGARHGVVATTENDYTHSLHGMFMLAINSMISSPLFETLIEDYKEAVMISEGVPVLGAQRSARSVTHYFFPDWLVSFPARSTVLESPEILSTVESKMGGADYEAVCDLHDRFFEDGGSAAAIWVPDSTGGVIHFIPVKNGKVVTANIWQYDTMLERILEAAATAAWADTKLTLFAANARYFAAGPARGYGLRDQPMNPGLNGKRAVNDIDEQCSKPEANDACSKRKVSKIKKARTKFRTKALSSLKALFDKVNDEATVSSKVIFLPSYHGTTSRPATFLVHVLALTMDKLMNGPTEAALELDHSAPTTIKVPLDDSSDVSSDVPKTTALPKPIAESLTEILRLTPDTITRGP